MKDEDGVQNPPCEGDIQVRVVEDEVIEAVEMAEWVLLCGLSMIKCQDLIKESDGIAQRIPNKFD